jgi:hypothetical protein
MGALARSRWQACVAPRCVPAHVRYAERLDHCDAVSFAVPLAAQAELTEFVEEVERGAPPELDVRHGLHLHQVIEAAEPI